MWKPGSGRTTLGTCTHLYADSNVKPANVLPNGTEEQDDS